MSTVQLLVICLTIVVLAVLALVGVTMRSVAAPEPVADDAWALNVGEHVVVHLDGEQSVEGIVLDADARGIRLEGAGFVSGGTDTPIGSAFVPYERVNLLQRLPSAVREATA